jgi:predicted amidohydrolase
MNTTTICFPLRVLLMIPLVALFHVSFTQSLTDTDPWQFSSQRPEIAPVNGIDDEIMIHDAPTLKLAGNGEKSANGCWFVNVPVKSMSWYRFKTLYKGENIAEQSRSVLARIIWQDAEGKLVNRPEYPATLADIDENGCSIIEQIYQVPEEAVSARIELIYRWDEDGQVNFGGTTMTLVEDPGPRKVRLDTIHHRPENSSGAMQNLEEFASFIERAARQGADIVCLPEGATQVGTQSNYMSASEPLPGPSSKFLGEIAKKHKLYIVAGILEKDGSTVYNTAILLDREGNLAGKYRKVSLPREEIEGGVTPGDSFPVFDTDFGKVGIMICWDVSFPEAARTLAFNGAEVIMMPIWGGHLTLAKARALENQVYLVSSTYDMKSAVFDQEGEIIGEASDENPVVVVEVDLNERKYWPWLGDFKNRIRREMPPQSALQTK